MHDVQNDRVLPSRTSDFGSQQKGKICLPHAEAGWNGGMGGVYTEKQKQTGFLLKMASKSTNFITVQEFTPYSPDLNPLYYSIWGILAAKASDKARWSPSSAMWRKPKQNRHKCPVVNQFPVSLRACFQANGGIFRNNLR